MARFYLLFVCVALAGCAGDPIIAESDWTPAIGHYTRTLGDMREEAVAAAEAPAYRPGFNWTAPSPWWGGGGGYWNWAELYVDTSRLQDLRYLERTAAQVTNHPFPGFNRPLCNMRSPDFYQEHRWMEFNLRSNETYRQFYGGYWRNSYSRLGTLAYP